MSHLFNLIGKGLSIIGSGLAQTGNVSKRQPSQNHFDSGNRSDFEKVGDDLRIAIKEFDERLDNGTKKM